MIKLKSLNQRIFGYKRICFLQNKFNKIDRTVFDKFISADPTPNKEYLSWIIDRYLKTDNKDNYLENINLIGDYLNTFHLYKKKNIISEKDINKYKNYRKLYLKLKEVGGLGETVDDEQYLVNDRYFINNSNASVFHEDSKHLIVIPKKYEASEFYGWKTQWCTKYPDQYAKYSSKGDLYVVIDKTKLNTADKYRMMQFHFESGQFKDIDGDDLPPSVKKGLFDNFKNVNLSFHLKYDRVWGFREGRAIVKLGGYFGFIDEAGREITTVKHDKVQHFKKGRAKIWLGTMRGCLDKEGNETWDSYH